MFFYPFFFTYWYSMTDFSWGQSLLSLASVRTRWNLNLVTYWVEDAKKEIKLETSDSFINFCNPRCKNETVRLSWVLLWSLPRGTERDQGSVTHHLPDPGLWLHLSRALLLWLSQDPCGPSTSQHYCGDKTTQSPLQVMLFPS